MANKSDVKNGDRWFGIPVAVVVAIITSALGSSGGTFLYLNRSGAEEIRKIARPDPFTGTEGLEVKRSLDTLRASIVDLQRQVDKLPPRELTERLSVVRREVELLRADFERHEASHQ